MGGRPFFEFPTKLRFLMRFNPLWLIVLLFLLPGAGLLFLPLLIFAALPLLLGLAGGGAFARAPGQLWALVKNARVRANFVLAHAAARVLGERYGVAPICWSGENSFFLSGVSDENAVYEAAEQALARLKSGEDDLKVYPACPVFRALAVVLAAAALVVPLLTLGPLGIVFAVAAGYFAAPYLSPWLQKLTLSSRGAKNCSVHSVRACTRTVSAWGGRLNTAESGVEVSTSAQDVIEAEIVED